MTKCFFVSDLHGKLGRFEVLFRELEREPPAILFIGGDVYPSGMRALRHGDDTVSHFHSDVLIGGFSRLRDVLRSRYPRVFLIPGNDDPAVLVPGLREGEESGLWHFAHMSRFDAGDWTIAGYACVPPTPFRLKDWEKYDVSRYVDPGCISPEEGLRTVPVEPHLIVHSTIADDLAALTADVDTSRCILLAHTPPYGGKLDRAALDGVSVDHAPLDVHVGSMALRRWIEKRQPRVTLHGHIHESARLTGSWHEEIGMTHAFSAAHDGAELSLLRFTPEDPASAVRQLL